MSIKRKIKQTVEKLSLRYSDMGYRKYFTDDKRTHSNTKLSKEQTNEAEEFYKPYFKLNPLFHAFYTEKTGRFEVDYIPDDIWFTDIDRHFNNRAKTKVLDHKSYYERMFSGASVKHPETILHRINGFWYDEKMRMLTKDEAEQIVACESSLFVKLSADSCGGRGVKHISKDDDILAQFRQYTEHDEDIVVQRAIKQHPELCKVGPTSVNSLRIVSLLSEKNVKIYSSILRMGIGGSLVDNASSGGISSGVAEDGRLKDPAYTMYGVKYDRHPTTNIRFSDIVIPSYDRVIALIKELHPMIPDFRLVAWDIAIDEQGDPVLIEVNLCMSGIDFHQLNNGSFFKEDTKKILDEVYGRKGK